MISIDIEVPKNCHHCIFNHGEYGTDYYEKCSCMLTGIGMGKSYYKRRPKSCPIIVEKKEAPKAKRFGSVVDKNDSTSGSTEGQ